MKNALANPLYTKLQNRREASLQKRRVLSREFRIAETSGRGFGVCQTIVGSGFRDLRFGVVVEALYVRESGIVQTISDHLHEFPESWWRSS